MESISKLFKSSPFSLQATLKVLNIHYEILCLEKLFRMAGTEWQQIFFFLNQIAY